MSGGSLYWGSKVPLPSGRRSQRMMFCASCAEFSPAGRGKNYVWTPVRFVPT